MVKDCLKNEVDIKEFYCDAAASRIQNIKSAAKHSDTINHITGDVNFLAFGLKGKNILTIHDLGHYDTLKGRNKIHFLIYKYFWLKFPLKKIDIVTVVSEFTKSKLIEYFNFPEDRIRLILNPVKPIFKFVKKENLHPNPVILMMGTGRHKNLGNLIAAAKGTNWHLRIIGWPSDEELAQLAANKVAYTIFNKLTDEEVYQHMIDCDVMYNASFYEGFGMPIIEAQSVGRPVITSNIGAMKEVAKASAVLVDPNKAEEIRNGINQLVTDRSFYDQVVDRGLANITPYQYDNIARQYLDVYKELSA